MGRIRLSIDLLPSCFAKCEIFQYEVIVNLDLDGREIIVYSMFHNIWTQHFGNFKVCLVGAFAKCNLCTCNVQGPVDEGKQNSTVLNRHCQ